MLIGREDQATLRLDNPAVSRCHAYLQVLGNRLFAVDLDSRTGLLHDGVSRPTGWLDRDQQLTVVPFHLHRVVGSFPDSLCKSPGGRLGGSLPLPPSQDGIRPRSAPMIPWRLLSEQTR